MRFVCVNLLSNCRGDILEAWFEREGVADVEGRFKTFATPYATRLKGELLSEGWGAGGAVAETTFTSLW